MAPPRVAWARVIAAIAGVEVRRRLRDRSLLIQGVLGPAVLALIVGLAFGSGSGSGVVSVDLWVLDEDRSPLSSGLVAGLVAASEEPDGPPVHVRMVEGRAEAVATVDGDGGAALVVPAGFARSVAAGSPLPLEVLSAGPSLAGDLALSVAERLASSVDSALIAAAATGDEALTPPPPALVFTEEPAGGDFDAISYFAPSMAMLFLFFTVGAGARSVLTERREGTLARVRAAPVGDRSILAGKALATIATGGLSVAAVWAITGLGFSGHWGDPAVVAAVMGLMVLVVAGIGALIVGLVRTDAQAESLTTAVAFVLALLGGNFINPGALPDLLAQLSRLTPNGWALDALVAASAGDAGLGDVGPTLAVLAAMAAVTGGIGLRLVGGKLR